MRWQSQFVRAWVRAYTQRHIDCSCECESVLIPVNSVILGEHDRILLLPLDDSLGSLIAIWSLEAEALES